MNRPKVAKTISFAVVAIAAIGMVVLSTAIAKSALAWSDNDNHDDDCYKMITTVITMHIIIYRILTTDTPYYSWSLTM
jgi:hypothetical protein